MAKTVTKDILEINGEPRRFSLIYDKGGHKRYLRTWDPKILVAAHSNVKPKLPRMALLDEQYSLICADFDKVPKGFNSFQSLFDYLEIRYSTAGIVVWSFSRNVKVFFPVSHEVPFKGYREVLPYLKQLLHDDDLYRACDFTAAAFYQTYLTSDMLIRLKKGLEVIRPIPILTDSKEERVLHCSISEDSRIDQIEDSPYFARAPKQLVCNDVPTFGTVTCARA